MTAQLSFDVHAVFGAIREISYKSKKSGNQVEGSEIQLIVEGLGICTFAFAENKVDAKLAAQFSSGETIIATLEPVKGYQDKLSIALVDIRPLE